MINGSVFATTGRVLDGRLNELAKTVCDNDPRTIGQLRTDALGALAAGQDRLACGCGKVDCPAGSAPKRPDSVVIHVVADRATVDEFGADSGFLYGDGIVPAEVVRELAKTAKLQPMTVPPAAESGYVPLRALSDFVRARPQLPGSGLRPATDCDIDYNRPATRRRRNLSVEPKMFVSKPPPA
ncbi:13E12 repeat family protein [Mycobacterium tilburgii]|uniref:13E12 repeat family protein n=1 Tax=Mycobacterium tilburgii TaxID=44467 RepID=UPI0021B33C71|nr:13E12 repeat family protein [Mycobacterium tilburgii]